jgi:hypothetical protein
VVAVRYCCRLSTPSIHSKQSNGPWPLKRLRLAPHKTKKPCTPANPKTLPQLLYKPSQNHSSTQPQPAQHIRAGLGFRHSHEVAQKPAQLPRRCFLLDRRAAGAHTKPKRGSARPNRLLGPEPCSAHALSRANTGPNQSQQPCHASTSQWNRNSHNCSSAAAAAATRPSAAADIHIDCTSSTTIWLLSSSHPGRRHRQWQNSGPSLLLQTNTTTSRLPADTVASSV